MSHPDPMMLVACPECGRRNFGFRFFCMGCHHPFVAPKEPGDKSHGEAVSIHLDDPLVRVIRGPWFDEDRYEQALRVNGYVVCIECDLIWPVIEGIEAWTEHEDGTWRAAEWGPGSAHCALCDLVFIDTFEGVLVLDPVTCEREGTSRD